MIAISVAPNVDTPTSIRAFLRRNRAEGALRYLFAPEAQLRPVVEDERYCIDILTQIAAVRTALEQVGAKLLEGHVTHCVVDALASGDERAATEKTTELLDAVQRFVRTR